MSMASGSCDVTGRYDYSAVVESQLYFSSFMGETGPSCYAPMVTCVESMNRKRSEKYIYRNLSCFLSYTTAERSDSEVESMSLLAVKTGRPSDE